jgi:hypothetical protein
MRNVALAAAIAYFPVVAAAQPAGNPPAKLAISTQTVASLVGAPVRLSIELENVSDHPVELNAKDWSYEFHLANANGVEIRPNSPSVGTPAPSGVPLQPGHYTLDEVCLSCVYRGFPVPGAYTLYLSHKVLSNGETSTVRSNEVAFRIVPEEGPDAPLPLEMTLSVPQTVVAYGDLVGYNLKLINRSNHDLDCGQTWSGAFNFTYPVKVFDASGKEVPARDFKFFAGESKSCTLPFGETKGWQTVLDLRDYPTLQPGTYTMRIHAANPDDQKSPGIDSNPVILTIQPAPQK